MIQCIYLYRAAFFNYIFQLSNSWRVKWNKLLDPPPPGVGNTEPMSQLWLSARFAVALGNALSQTPLVSNTVPKYTHWLCFISALALSFRLLAHPCPPSMWSSFKMLFQSSTTSETPRNSRFVTNQIQALKSP